MPNREVSTQTDIILPMAYTATEDYMQQIVDRTKAYEFRKRLYPATVKRIWFYETAPKSGITPLPLDGIGNKEYNERDPSFEGYDYAYRVKSCYRLLEPISLNDMGERYGIGGAPRGMVYVPRKMMEDVQWDMQESIWTMG